MNRTYLTRAIRELAGVYGYTIHTLSLIHI